MRRWVHLYEELLHTAADTVARQRDPLRSFADAVVLADQIIAQADLIQFAMGMDVVRRLNAGDDVPDAECRAMSLQIAALYSKLAAKLVEISIARLSEG